MSDTALGVSTGRVRENITQTLTSSGPAPPAGQNVNFAERLNLSENIHILPEFLVSPQL